MHNQQDGFEDHGDPRGGDDAPDFDLLQHTLESLSLTGMEARTLVALVRLGTANPAQLAHLSGISRSNLYSVLDSLATKGLCQRVPGRYALWVSPEPSDLFAVLQAAEEARIDSARQSALQHLGKAQAVLAKVPETKRRETPMTLVDSARLTVLYAEAMASADSEVLVLNRGPYGGEMEPDPAVLEALDRGVTARAIWVAAELDAADGMLRRCADTYAAAGVDQRVLDSLPAAMAVIGGGTVLLVLPSRDPASMVACSGAVIRHEGMAELQTAAFEHLWAKARAYEPSSSGGWGPTGEDDELAAVGATATASSMEQQR